MKHAVGTRRSAARRVDLEYDTLYSPWRTQTSSLRVEMLA